MICALKKGGPGKIPVPSKKPTKEPTKDPSSEDKDGEGEQNEPAHSNDGDTRVKRLGKRAPKRGFSNDLFKDDDWKFMTERRRRIAEKFAFDNGYGNDSPKAGETMRMAFKDIHSKVGDQDHPFDGIRVQYAGGIEPPINPADIRHT